MNRRQIIATTLIAVATLFIGFVGGVYFGGRAGALTGEIRHLMLASAAGEQAYTVYRTGTYDQAKAVLLFHVGILDKMREANPSESSTTLLSDSALSYARLGLTTK